MKKADIVIINTCTVTIKADSKCRYIIRKSRKENPNCLLIVCGCFVDTNLDDLLNINEIDILIKNSDKDKIYNAINDYFNNKILKKPYFYKTNKDGSFNFNTSLMSKHSRVFLKIQDGCDNFCSYCKIPYARGNPRSRNFDDIINEVNSFIQNGYEEIVLTGINLGSYKYKDLNFANLIARLSESFSQIRFRLSSIEPQYIDENFLKSYSLKNICPHIHIPLQSGSNKILKLMNRQYNIDDFYNKICSIRNIKNNSFISTDLILGFPGENEADFLNTIDFIKKINFSFIHIFGYSPRKETSAYNLKNRVCERVRDERVKMVKKIVDEMDLNYREKFINKELEVVIERQLKQYYTGKSENYLNLLINKKGKKLETKKRYKVIFTKIVNNKNYAKLK